jgi:hypothetical protein
MRHLDHGQPTRAAAKTSLGRWVMPFTECRLPGVVSVVTITVALVLTQIPLLAMVITLVGHAVRGATGPAHPPSINLARRSRPRW